MIDMNMAATKTTHRHLLADQRRRARAAGQPLTGKVRVCLHDVLPGIRPPGRCRLGLLGLPEDLVDLLDLGQQLVRLGHVHAALGPRGPGELGGLVEQLVQLRVLLEVRRLEVVGSIVSDE
jgi:hypothetical protein